MRHINEYKKTYVDSLKHTRTWKLTDQVQTVLTYFRSPPVSLPNCLTLPAFKDTLLHNPVPSCSLYLAWLSWPSLSLGRPVPPHTVEVKWSLSLLWQMRHDQKWLGKSCKSRCKFCLILSCCLPQAAFWVVAVPLAMVLKWRQCHWESRELKLSWQSADVLGQSAITAQQKLNAPMQTPCSSVTVVLDSPWGYFPMNPCKLKMS